VMAVLARVVEVRITPEVNGLAQPAPTLMPQVPVHD
jgi:hypothetical protein